MKTIKSILLGIVAALGLSACGSQVVQIQNPDNTTTTVEYYAGGESMQDLLVIDGEFVYGELTYAWDDPLTDLTLKSDAGIVIAECVGAFKDVGMDDPQITCYEYQVVVSTVDGIDNSATFIVAHDPINPIYITGSLANAGESTTTTVSKPIPAFRKV